MTQSFLRSPEHRHKKAYCEHRYGKFRGIDSERIPLLRGRKCSFRVLRNRIPSRFLFRGMVRNGIPRVLLKFLFHGTEFRAFFSFSEWYGTEFREFCVPQNSRNFVGINQLFRLCYLPRNNFFL
jgi:hypothetical protein